ncbi:MAG: hypothetical protein GY915_06235 [bacterium]|nr:hypothetical protein [bacterium]
MPTQVKASHVGLAFEQLGEDIFNRINSIRNLPSDLLKKGQRTYSTVRENLQEPEIQQHIKTTSAFFAVKGLDVLSWFAVGPYRYVFQCGRLPFAAYGLYHSCDFLFSDKERNFGHGVPDQEALKNRLSFQNCAGIGSSFLKNFDLFSSTCYLVNELGGFAFLFMSFVDLGQLITTEE